MIRNLVSKWAEKLGWVKPANDVIAICPRKRDGVWQFDDRARGLRAEPLVGLTNRAVDIMLLESRVDPNKPFHLFFSEVQPPMRAFPCVLDKHDPNGWSVYLFRTLRCPVCPALLKYFRKPPQTLWVWASA